MVCVKVCGECSSCVETPQGFCYSRDVEVLLDNCELAKLQGSANIKVDLTILNNASLPAVGSFTVTQVRL